MTTIPMFRDRDSRWRDHDSRFRGYYYGWRDHHSQVVHLLKNAGFRDRYSRLLDG